jgi:hypothetical protein
LGHYLKCKVLAENFQMWLEVMLLSRNFSLQKSCTFWNSSALHEVIMLKEQGIFKIRKITITKCGCSSLVLVHWDQWNHLKGETHFVLLSEC